MNNEEVVKLFRAISGAYEIEDESVFRIRAYENAADSIEHANREVKDLWEEGRLGDLPGVGPNIAGHIDELFRKGKVDHFQTVLARLPEAMFELIGIPGIGPKTAYKLVKKLGISKAHGAIRRIKEAARLGRIQKIEGFGKESESEILKGIEEYQRRENRMLLPQATQIAEELQTYMEREKAVEKIDTLGSLRRRTSTVGDVDVAVATKDPSKVISHFTRFPHAKDILASGENTARLVHRSGRQIDVKTEKPDRYGALLQHFTGSKSHNIHLREIALEQNLSLSEHGIRKKGKIAAFASEAEFYKALGMQWIPPELREDQGEIEAALEAKLPELIKKEEIRGDLHLHTDYPWRSAHDTGANTMREMVEKAMELGYEYVGIGDHNPSLTEYNRKEIIIEIKKRSEEIDKLKYSIEITHENRTIHILNTLEIDIRTDGSLAIPDEGLVMLDYAVASVHSSMRIPKAKMTERILKGLSHPKVKILGHPTGRLLNQREGYEADWDKIFSFAKENGKFIEINAWPTRLDLPDTLVRQAIRMGVQLVIDTDAHAIEHMDLMRYGVDVARRGWAEARHILNTRPYSELEKILLTKTQV
ncbi:MAG: hypothetical protein A2900_03925 [Candidatus Chisholmbacteria bacterium RIFCSPLOWO2_01_FULL_50_28]|uniref:DNA-directed DNA polymerase n=1 Tax=Candidatus Chisholmbacteria bacterium RIFCSPHIGHO2_01_FULL_52_32 TaxID=1797591 RepID=A0A1G1VSS4_9BACT|nr:MAG: hypothetical protein A2786_02820 [Candidatus Chisholmbacteria bacterium RIFCSPHIGHO2_01_FULL_52_32]OGY20219.1 MAG: hypothetical protein A2900_03925 [Candidatus Chisholmbacteria bacterium RIFCSPLOWO2_01_FULL_50_28]